MPIPQLQPGRHGQSWRDQSKKYYIKRKKEGKVKMASGFRARSEKYSHGFGFNKAYFKSLFLSKDFLRRAVMVLVGGFVLATLLFFWITRGLPDVNNLTAREVAQSTIIYDRTGGNALYEVHGDVKRTLVKLSDIPDEIKWATISVEDKNFYQHKGLSILGIVRGVIKTYVFGDRQGGSTLTQQFIKNAVLTPERTITRKLKEWRLSYKIEEALTKDQILELYLNEIPYGSVAYGVEAASQRYFGKSVKDINLAEAAVLAAIPQAPSYYSPYGPNKDALIERQRFVLNLMVEQGYITEARAEEAKQTELNFAAPAEQMKAPHFVMYIKEQLSQDFGFTEKDIEQGGYRVTTSLDLDKQKIAEEVITEKAQANLDNYNAENAALVSIDPKTGEVLALVGSKDFYSEEIDGQFNVATSLRQPGSSLKPLVYAALFTRGYTPNTILYDVVTNFSASGQAYEPHNYSNGEMGPVTVRKALAGSLNIPAVKAIYLAGIDKVIEIAKDAGYSSLTDPDRYGLSLVLGGAEVKLLEHTNAYSAFAREGLVQPVTSILKIEDKDGNIVYEWKQGEPKKALDTDVARMINSILSDNNARSYIFGAQNYLTLGSRPVAAKTGTTNDYRDAWTVGYTPSIVTGVWTGNNDNSAMKMGADGSKIAAPIWNEYMKRVLGDTPIEYFNDWSNKKTGKAVIDGDTKSGEIVRIDRASGLLATEYTPASFVEEKVYRKDHCILYYVDKNDPLGSAPSNPASDPQFNLWESRVLEWSKKQMEATSTEATDLEPPTEYDNLHTPERRPQFTILTPRANETLTDSTLNVEIEATAPRGVRKVNYFINDNLLATVTEPPFNLSKQVNVLKNGYHNLKVQVCDDIDNCSEASQEFNLILDEDQIGLSGDISLDWLAPTPGYTLDINNFPLEVRISNTNPDRITKIIVYAKAAEQDPYAPIVTMQPIDITTAVGVWPGVARPGTYKLYAEAHGWGGELVKSKEIIVIVNEAVAQ